MKRLYVIVVLLSLFAAINAANWTGAVNTNWSTSGNWSTGAVPTSTVDAVIPNVTNKPIINAAANCRDLTVQTGSSLTINSTFNLTVSGTAAFYGALNMSSSGDLYVTGTTFFESGSTANITNSSATLYLSYNLQFGAGSNVQMTSGVIYMQGSLASTDLANFSTNTQINALTIAKSSGTSFSIRTGSQPFTINSHITNQAGNTFYNYYTGNITLKGNISDLNTDPAFGIKWDNGTLIMDGAGQSIGVRSTTCYLKNLTFSQTGTAQLTYPLTLKGNLRIESGVFFPQAHNISLTGDWENVVGPAAFTEGTAARVIFNGTSHQYVNFTETFNILEVNKSAGALRVDSSSAVVTCAQYDWTAGAIDVLAGTFTALDLVDNGLVGKYYVNPSATINLTNADGLVDLDGLVNFNGGGTINVYGGTAWSTWKNVDLTMNGGTFAFHDQGVYINGSSSYTFSASLTGGTIKVGGNFQCNRPIAPSSSSSMEFTGSGVNSLYMVSGTLNRMIVSKSGTGYIYLVNSLTTTGYITIQTGKLSLGSETLTCAGNLNIYGGLTMPNASAVLNVAGSVTWQNGSYSEITLGTINCNNTWSMYSTSNVQIPNAVTLNFNSPTLARSILNYSATNYLGNVKIGDTSTGTVYTLSSASSADLRIVGNLTIAAGSELDLGTGSRGLIVDGILSLYGTLDIHANTATVHGKPNFYSGSTLNIDTGSFDCDYAVAPTTYLYGNLSINSGTLNLPTRSFTVYNSGLVTLASGTIVCTGITATTAGTFQPAGGTVSLLSNLAGARAPLNVSNGNWLPNVSLDTTIGFYLADNLIIKGNLTILSSFLEARLYSSTDTYNITISGNWNNQGGTFYPDTGKVTFNGSGHQYVNYTETFNIVEANKSGGAIRVDGAGITVTCAQYDWTAGSVDVLTGTLTINDLADNGMYGGFYCNTGGTLNIVQDAAQTLDLYGLIQLSGGTMNISGGSGAEAYWARYSASTVNMSGGTLNYLDKGIQIRNTYTLTYAISGGTISTAGQLYCNRTDFVPTGGTFEMTGNTDTNLDFQNAMGSSPYNLKINKTGLLTRVSQAASSQTIRGTLTIDNGTYYMTNRTLNCLGSLIVNSDAKLFCQNYNTVKVGSAITVNSGGYIDVLGSSNETRTTFTRYGEGTYFIFVNAGGHLGANYATFEYFDIMGLYIGLGGIVDGLHNCIFQNGTAGAPLLWVANEQDFTMTFANFPTNAGGWAKNIRKTNQLGSITLSNYSGVFSGAAYEDDSFGRIFWTGTANDLLISEVILGRPDSYVCAPLTVTVTVTNSGSNDIATPFRVDFYKNLTSAPPAGTLGDHYLEISSLNAGQSKTVTFTNVSTDLVETWNSWLRLDTTGFIVETNEANNVSGSYINQWLALPDIANPSLVRTTGLTGIRLNWTYPISVSRYKVYRSTDPYFVPGPANLWVQTSSQFVDTTATNPKYFYRIKAERDMP